MKHLTRNQLSSRALAMKQAMQIINRTVAICEAQGVFSDERRAELQAASVIVRRAISDIYSKYETIPA